MRVKQLWNYTPVPAKTKILWQRITLSRLTIGYFIFSIIHFTIQIAFQIKAFTINANAASLLSNIVVQGNATNSSLPILRGDVIHMCSWVPSDLSLDGDNCFVVWNGTEGVNAAGPQVANQSSNDAVSMVPSIPITSLTPVSTSTLPLSSLSASLNNVPLSSTSLSESVPVAQTFATTTTFTPTQTITVFVKPTSGTNNGADENSNPSIEVNGLAGEDTLGFRAVFGRDTPQVLAFQEDGHTVVNVSSKGSENTLEPSCLWSLNWPVSVLRDTKREDLVFIAFQFWVLGMSIVALLNESIPHILASLVTHVIATAWAAFQIKHTADFHATFTHVITDGACNGISLLPDYWEERARAEIASLAFHVLALFISSFLTWKLMKFFGWQTFKRVGASLTINRIYKIVLTLYITIQLCLFFVGVTVSLWLDQLFNSAIGDLTTFQTLYKVSSFITLALLIPWLMTGWSGVRHELRALMFAFLLLSVLYLAGWGVMFFSTTFRWTFVTWQLFSIMATASVLLVIISLVLGVFCRYNFGKGLLPHLNAQQNLPDDDFVYYKGSDIEKVDFPSNETPVPTYSAFPGPNVAAAGRTRGPRFFNPFAAPFETVKTSLVAPPPTAHTLMRKASDGSQNKTTGITRSDTRSSNSSTGSLASFYSYSDKSHGRTDSQKRWIIE